MNRRRLFAIGALVLALPLFVYPIASPPPDPPDTVVYNANDVGEVPPQDEGDFRRIGYENLSTDARRIVEETVAAGERGSYEVPQGEGVPSVFNESGRPTWIEYQNATYQIYSYEQTTGPSLSALGTRLGALVVSILLGTVGGYLVLANE